MALVVEIDETHNSTKSLVEQKMFYGSDCLREFCEWLLSPENANSTVIAHNQAGYDGKVILSYCINSCLVPSKYI